MLNSKFDRNRLEKYDLVYLFIKPPSIIFTAKTNCSELLYFKESFEVPENIANSLITCHFLLYNSNGEFVNAETQVTHKNIMHNIANNIPLLLLESSGLIELSSSDKNKLNRELINTINHRLK